MKATSCSLELLDNFCLLGRGLKRFPPIFKSGNSDFLPQGIKVHELPYQVAKMWRKMQLKLSDVRSRQIPSGTGFFRASTVPAILSD